MKKKTGFYLPPFVKSLYNSLKKNEFFKTLIMFYLKTYI